MHFLAQAFVFTRFLGFGIADQDEPNAHHHVFREFGETLLSLVETPRATARIRALRVH